MIITDQAKQFMLELSDQGTTKAFHLFSTDTCCGKGVGLKIVPKKHTDYIEVEGLSFKFEREMLFMLHGMVIDVVETDGQQNIQVQTQ